MLEWFLISFMQPFSCNCCAIVKGLTWNSKTITHGQKKLGLGPDLCVNRGMDQIFSRQRLYIFYTSHSVDNTLTISRPTTESKNYSLYYRIHVVKNDLSTSHERNEYGLCYVSNGK